jgi:hypothetical protein
METIGLPSTVQTTFDSGRYPSASKGESNLEVSVDSGIGLPGLLESGLVDDFAHFSNKHLHWNSPPV